MTTEDTPTPAPGDLYARDQHFYLITEVRDSLDGPLVVADAQLEDHQPRQRILKAADCRPAGLAGGTRIWES
jgi:hypothetical protein